MIVYYIPYLFDIETGIKLFLNLFLFISDFDFFIIIIFFKNDHISFH